MLVSGFSQSPGCQLLDTYTGEVVSDVNCNNVPDFMEQASQNHIMPKQDALHDQDLADKDLADIKFRSYELEIDYARYREVNSGEGMFYPIDIMNPSDFTIFLELKVSDTRDFASFKFMPSSVISVRPKETERAYIYLDIDETAGPGWYDFTVFVSQCDACEANPEGIDIESSSLDMKLQVVDGPKHVVSQRPGDSSIILKSGSRVRAGTANDILVGGNRAVEILLIILILVLLVIGLVIGYDKLRKQQGLQNK